jgi:hypothetical protein
MRFVCQWENSLTCLKNFLNILWAKSGPDVPKRSGPSCPCCPFRLGSQMGCLAEVTAPACPRAA